MDGLSQAISLFLGWKSTSFSQEDEARVIAKFGPARGKELVAEAGSILGELNLIKYDWQKHTLVEGAKAAVEQLKVRHPDLDDEATSALEWAYAWWWK